MALELYAERMPAVAEQDPTNGQCFAACSQMAEEAHRALDFEAADALIRRSYRPTALPWSTTYTRHIALDHVV
jgi:hypothetical protein